MMKTNWKDILYVSVQFVFLIVYLIVDNIIPFHLPYLVKIIFLLIAFIGLIVLSVAIFQLNKNLTPFPTPKSNSDLVSTGIYAWVRHPIYAGIIYFAFGYAIYSAHFIRLIIAFLLFILFYFKSSYEENLLRKKFSNYSYYQKRTGRFFPFI